MKKYFIPLIIALLALTTLACVVQMKLDETFSGSDDYIQYLTEDMVINEVYPTGEISTDVPYEFIVALNNQGNKTVHLKDLYVPVDGAGTTNMQCSVQPQAEMERNDSSSYFYFTFPGTEVGPGLTTITLRCTFFAPGRYQVSVLPSFTESTHSFTSIVTDLTVK